MSEVDGAGLPEQPSPPSDTAAVTAGGLLRQARMAKGLHIAALATSIKVAPRKLELLEADRFHELPGATFTRALAQTVCRTLKIDPAPVLALLPQPVDQGLSQMSTGLNAPFRDRPGRHVPSDLQFLKSPMVLGVGALLVASLALYLAPTGWMGEMAQRAGSTTAPSNPDAATRIESVILPPATTPAALPEPASAAAAPAAVTASAVAPAVAPYASAAASLPGPVAAPPAAASAVGAAVSGALLLRASAESWVEVVDGRGAPLFSRLMHAGEAVGLDGPTPLRVRIGNASATQVSFKGRAVELAPTRDNVAKLELR